MCFGLSVFYFANGYVFCTLLIFVIPIIFVSFFKLLLEIILNAISVNINLKTTIDINVGIINEIETSIFFIKKDMINPTIGNKNIIDNIIRKALLIVISTNPFFDSNFPFKTQNAPRPGSDEIILNPFSFTCPINAFLVHSEERESVISVLFSNSDSAFELSFNNSIS